MATRLRTPRLRARQVNLLLGSAVVASALTGVASWIVGDRWSGLFVAAHSITGIALVLLVPAKLRGPVAAGFRRGRATRWLSAAFGAGVLGIVVLGVVHAIGLWYGVGAWSPLWTHTIGAFVLAPVFVWHLATRPVRPRPADLDRRALLTSVLGLGGATAIYVAQRALSGAAGLADGHRATTGSHEVASHRPEQMPAVIWLDDHRPVSTDPATWSLVIDGQRVSIESLHARARPLVATLDCTGGWWSEQSWDAVPLSGLIDPRRGRSIRVRSATGYDRYFAPGELAFIYLAVGYGGEPLRPGHGAPVRLVVPGRRGPWWVKWVATVEASGRPPWLQSPLPLT